MSRSTIVALTLILYVVAMALVWWGLKTWGEPALRSFYDAAGGPAAWFVLALILAVVGVAVFWPRTPDGRMRRLLPRRD